MTGGSDGIGKIVVQLLAERGIKVAVLDVQDLTYEGKTDRQCGLQCHHEVEDTDVSQHRRQFATSTAISPPRPP